MAEPYKVTHISEIPAPTVREEGEGEWKSLRHHFGLQAFGGSAYVAHEASDWVVPEHDEASSSIATSTPHEELYFVASGRAEFRVGDDTFDAPAGTFVFVRDPALVRTATARSEGTTVLAFGGAPGEAFAVSPWELRSTGAAVEG
jgi:mannose-6-phosphate isomerase-like protein (cupin superfamily)